MSFSSSFPICIPFISVSALIAVAKSSKSMLNSSGESGHPCLVPDFKGNAFNFSPLRIMFATSDQHYSLPKTLTKEAYLKGDIVNIYKL